VSAAYFADPDETGIPCSTFREGAALCLQDRSPVVNVNAAPTRVRDCTCATGSPHPEGTSPDQKAGNGSTPKVRQ
jgi:hypothetical protein